MMHCPKCDGEIDALAFQEWGHGRHPVDCPVAPFICSWCASLLLIDFARCRLYLVPQEGLDAMRQNPVLWSQIIDSQRRILAAPNRRPVLR
jgi:hypothetical protein